MNLFNGVEQIFLAADARIEFPTWHFSVFSLQLHSGEMLRNYGKKNRSHPLNIQIYFLQMLIEIDLRYSFTIFTSFAWKEKKKMKQEEISNYFYDFKSPANFLP